MQVLSDSVSTGIVILIAARDLSPTDATTAEFLEQMDVFFCTLKNSSDKWGDNKKMGLQWQHPQVARKFFIGRMSIFAA